MKRQLQAGHILPLIAAMLGILMGFGGIAVDAGFWKYRFQAQQTATDAAALGGAQSLVRSSCGDGVTAKSVAQADATTNGFPNAGNVVVTTDSPPKSGPFAGNNCAMNVTITTSHVQATFARFFGYAAGVTESTQATATVSANSAACIYLLSTTVQTNFNGANINAPGCAIAINDTANFNGSTVASPNIGYAGGTPNENGAHFPLAAPQPMLPVTDPCPEIPGCAYLAANPPSQNNCQSFNGNGFHGTLPQGCYSSLNLNGAVVQLDGTYTFSGSTNFNGATFTTGPDGVTMYVPAGGGVPNFNGTNSTLTPPATGGSAGVLYYQVPSNNGNPNFNGTNVSVSGLIYAPGGTSVNFNGAHGGYMVLVFGAANNNGSYAWDFATPAPGQSITRQAVLTQ